MREDSDYGPAKKIGFSRTSRCPFRGQAGTPFYPLPKDLGLINLIFSFRRWVGSSPLGKEANSWLGSPRSEEKINKNVTGSSFVLIVGNVGGEEQDCV